MKNDKENLGISANKSNYIISVRFNHNNQCKNTSKSFYSKQKIDVLLSKLKEFDEKHKNEEHEFYVILNNKDSDEKKYLKIHFNTNDVNKIKESIKFINVNVKKYRVEIRNEQSLNYDVKQKLIQSKYDFDEVFEKIRLLINNIVESEFDNMIIFPNEKFNTSHRVYLFEIENGRNKCCKSFKVILPNYSSSELMGLLESKIEVKK